MKKIITFLFSITSHSLFAQVNLVPNPSFEDTVSCPTTANQIDKAVGWHASRESPDYFNACDFITGSGSSVPNNFVGYQYPRTGDAYTGFLGYYRPSPNGREYFTCQLLAPLIIGRNYAVSLYVSWSAGSPSDLITCNKLGLKFTNANYFLPSNPLSIDNQSNIFTDTIVRDSLGWFKISGLFTADSSYQYLSIGNFFDDIHTDTLMLGFNSSDAYYYVDDVSVIEDTTTSMSELNFGKTFIYPNPVMDKLKILNSKIKISSIEILSIQGNLVTRIANLPPQDYFEISLSTLATGTYILKIADINNKTFNYKLLKL